MSNCESTLHAYLQPRRLHPLPEVRGEDVRPLRVGQRLALQRVALRVNLVRGVDQHGVVLDQRLSVLPTLLVLNGQKGGCVNQLKL